MNYFWLLLIPVGVLSYVLLGLAMKDNFRPRRRAQFLLFCAGLLPSAVGMWLLLTDEPISVRTLVSLVIGSIGGLGTMFVFPKRWEYINSQIRKSNDP